MSQQENINNLLSKMAETLQIVKECEVLMLEEIKQIEQLREEKTRLSEQITTLNDELSLIHRSIEAIKTIKIPEIAVKDEDVEVKPSPTVVEVSAPIVETPSPVIETPEPTVETPAPVIETPVPAIEKQAVETLADKFQGQPSVHDKIAVKSEVSTTGARVSDIAKAVSISDRLLFIRELFGSNEMFTQTVKHLNGLQNFDEAQQYLVESFPHWDKENSTAQLFIAVIRRRYV